MRRTLAHMTAVATLASLIAVGAAHAEQASGVAAQSGTANPQAERMFKRFDANGDGQITRNEAKGRLAARFALMDADRDGMVTRTERQNHRFARVDKNGNGLIEKHELEALSRPRAKRRLAQLDSNGDGAVSLAELRAGKPRRGKGMKGPMTLQDLDARVMRMFDRADQNRDGVITSEEAQLMRRHDRRS